MKHLLSSLVCLAVSVAQLPLHAQNRRNLAAGDRLDACTVITALPATITTSGRYCLDESHTVVFPNDGVAVSIRADDVVFDLRGHSISNTADTSASYAVGILASGQSVTVRNGTVRRFLYGVHFQQTELGRIEEIRTDGCTYAGIRVDGKGVVVRACQVFNTTGPKPYPTGLNAGIGAFGSGNRIVDNDVIDVFPHGAGTSSSSIWMNSCDDCVVEGNRISNSRLEMHTAGIGGGFSERTIVFGNRVVNVETGIYGYGNTGIFYRGNTTFACTNSFGPGIDGGDNR